jgi:hypothetical protein
MMEAVRTSETSVDNHFTRQYIPEDNSENLRKFLRIVGIYQAVRTALQPTSTYHDTIYTGRNV